MITLLSLLYLSYPLSTMVIITTFNLFILMLLNTNILPEVSDFGASYFTTWQLNHLLSNFTLQPSSESNPYSGTSIQAQIPRASFKLMQSFYCSCCVYSLSVMLPLFFVVLFKRLSAQLLALLCDGFHSPFGVIN